MPDTVNHPAHYGGEDDPYECIKVAEAWGFDKNAYLFNVLKYIRREKGHTLEDLKKARWYLDRLIARLERKQAGQEAFVSISATGVEPKSTRFTLAGYSIEIDWIAHSYRVTGGSGSAGGYRVTGGSGSALLSCD